MRILVAKYWKNFKKTITTKEGKTKTIKDGKQFEKLVKAILDLEYGEDLWIDTGETWDGSRDFEWRTPDFYKWAECKNYASSISLNVISNTLVMALIDFADEVLIFSYSKIKEPVLKKLIQFADISQKTLRIYADESLEEIVLKHILQLKKDFFPNYDADTSTTLLLPPYVSCNIISDPVTAYTLNMDLGCIPSKPDTISFNSVLCISIFIFNQTAQEKAFSIDINWTESNHCFKTLNPQKEQSINFLLDANKTVVKKIYFEAIIYNPILYFPTIRVCCDEFSKDFAFGSVKCSWMGECTLQGSSYKKIKADFQSIIKNSKFYKAINIYGPSGIGKSRLLVECEKIALGYGYRAIRFTSSNKRDSDNVLQKMITKFICALYDIPDLDEYIQSSDSENLSDIYKLISKFKANPHDEAYLKHTIIPIITQKLRNTKCYITFDNIQYYPELFISFLNEIVDNLIISNRHCKSRMGFAFNTDYIFHQSECSNFYTFLVSNRESIQNEKLTGFSTDRESKVFLNQLLPNRNIDDLYINKIISVSQNNPFYIQSYLKTLEIQGILERRQDCYIIPQHQYTNFKEKVNCIPEDILEIIKKRWTSYLCEHDQNASVKILAVLHIFEYLNNELIQSFALSKQLVEDLYKYHFLKLNEENDIIYSFEHDTTEKFFAKEYFPLCEYAYDNTIDMSCITDFWCIRISDIIYNKKISICDLEQMIRNDLPYKTGLEIYTLLINYLIKHIQSTSDLDQYLSCICNVCANTRELYGTIASIALYKKIVGKVENDFPNYQANIHWAWAMISYGNLLYENNCYSDAINCIKNLLLYWTEAKVCDENNTIYCYLYNRLHVYTRALSRYITYDSLVWLEKSEKLQKSAEETFLNLIDRGYCKYDSISSKEEILRFWSEACRIYESNNLPSKKMNYYYTKIRVNLFSGEFETVHNTIQEGLRVIELKEEGAYYFTYFKQRYLMCKITLLLLEYNNTNNNIIIETFREVEDINYILKGRVASSIYWLKSIFYFMTHQYLDSFLCIQSAIEALFINKKMTFQNIYLKQIYANAEYFMANSLIDDGFIMDLTQLANGHLISRLKKIINLSTEECSNYIARHQATGLLQTFDHKISFPVL